LESGDQRTFTQLEALAAMLMLGRCNPRLRYDRAKRDIPVPRSHSVSYSAFLNCLASLNRSRDLTLSMRQDRDLV